MATKRRTDSAVPAPPSVRVRASLALDGMKRGDTITTTLTDRVQRLLDSGHLELLETVQEPQTEAVPEPTE